MALLELKDGTTVSGTAFGAPLSVAGEVVFNTGMVGYPEALTDPSYRGQILVLTYPLVGNYGVPEDDPSEGISHQFESPRIQVAGLVVSEHARRFSHRTARRTLDEWLRAGGVPALSGIDTRMVTQKLRTAGSMLGRLLCGGSDVDFDDPNSRNLVAEVSTRAPVRYGRGSKRVVVVDCGCKHGILRALSRRGLEIVVVPWDWPAEREGADAVIFSNGPGDPRQAEATVATARRLMEKRVPILGICLGSQILALAAGAETFKLKYGHRSHNQPCVLVGSKRCFITSQNHGYAVDEKSLPPDWVPWFFNANDGTNEGIRHRERPFMGVQFHPEASPGPTDTEFVFDDFIGSI